MSVQILEEFNSHSQKTFYALCAAVSISIACVVVRIIKGFIKALPLFRKLFLKNDPSGFRWESLWELQDLDQEKQFKNHKSLVIGTEKEFLNKVVL